MRKKRTPAKWITACRNHPMSFLQRVLVFLAAFITFSILVALIVYILVMGVPNLRPSLFAWKYTSENASMLPAIINTLVMIVLVLLLSVPFGVGAAIYLVEYAKRGNKLVKLVRITAETLSGIPSIVYGLFGFLMFVVALHMGNSMLAGALTLAIMVLPTIMTTTEEALTSIPDSYREGSFGLGAGKLRTVFKVILPSAIPGILAGVILSVGRIVGETAALIFTAGSVAAVPENLLDSGRTLAVHMYVLFNEGLSMEQAYGTAVILLILVLIINLLSNLVARCLVKKNNQ